MKKALLNIDYTNDFVAENGALTCGEPGQDIHDKIMQLTQFFYEDGDFIVFAVDKHELNDGFHPEQELFPPHNIEGTEGRRLYGDLDTYYQSIKNSDNVFYTDKTRYSAFKGTELEIKLRERRVEELHLIGVCTDICILHTAVDAYNKGFKIVIHEGAVASFDPTGHDWALKHFKTTLGAEIR